MDFSGVPVSSMPRRVRVQARQVFVLSALTSAGWGDYTQQAQASMHWLTERAFMPDGEPGWVHRLNPDGSVLDSVRDLYDHAFILLALGTLYSATQNSSYLDQADETLEFLDQMMASPAGGYVESIGGEPGPRRQNPHMHFFEAMLALYAATKRADYRRRLDALFALFEGLFLDVEAGVVREFFESDWSRLAGKDGDLCEPGHACEWVWLLSEYNRLTGVRTQPIAQRLFETAMSVGINPQTGLLNAAMTVDAKVVNSASRSWMQTEWMRAASAMMRWGEASAEQRLEQCLKVSQQRHFSSVLPGGWVDQVDGNGQQACSVMPTSTLYHVVGALLEVEQAGKTR
ncbi:MAG: hypothetical protein GYB36_00805 [Alphaproteobacteria bacterium]|nr:hypothetical protein [Alphaproteobacteria bacterium]